MNKKGEGLSFLKDLYSEKGFCLNFFVNLKDGTVCITSPSLIYFFIELTTL